MSIKNTFATLAANPVVTYNTDTLVEGDFSVKQITEAGQSARKTIANILYGEAIAEEVKAHLIRTAGFVTLAGALDDAIRKLKLIGATDEFIITTVVKKFAQSIEKERKAFGKLKMLLPCDGLTQYAGVEGMKLVRKNWRSDAWIEKDRAQIRIAKEQAMLEIARAEQTAEREKMQAEIDAMKASKEPDTTNQQADQSASENEPQQADQSASENEPQQADQSASENEPQQADWSASENEPQQADQSASENEPQQADQSASGTATTNESEVILKAMLDMLHKLSQDQITTLIDAATALKVA